MKISKKLGIFALSGALVLGVGVMTSVSTMHAAVGVEAADPTTTWGLIGSMSGSNWGNNIAFTYSSANSRFEITMDLSANTTFKLRKGNDWNGSQINYYSAGYGAGVKAYCSASGDNFMIKETGNYTFTLVSGIEGYGDASYGFDMIKNDVTTYKVTYYNGETEIHSEDVLDGSKASAGYIYQEGYGFDGTWYTDADLTTAYDYSAITADTNLYGNYIAGGTQVVYIDAGEAYASGAYLYAWKVDAGTYISWPGAEMTRVEGNIYCTEIDSLYGFDSFIINNNNGTQTADLVLPSLTTPFITLDSSVAGYTSTEFQVSLYKNWMNLDGTGPITVNNRTNIAEANKAPTSLDMYFVPGDVVKVTLNDIWVTARFNTTDLEGVFEVDADGNLAYVGSAPYAATLSFGPDLGFHVAEADAAKVEDMKAAREAEYVNLVKSLTEGQTICQTNVGVLAEYQDFFADVVETYDRLVIGGLDLSEVAETIEVVRGGLPQAVGSINVLFAANNTSTSIIACIVVVTLATGALVLTICLKRKENN